MCLINSLNSAKELIPSAEKVVIHLLNNEEQTLTPAAVAGYEKSTEGKSKMRLGEGVAGQVITHGETINIADIDTNSRFIKLSVQPKFRSLMVAPVIQRRTEIRNDQHPKQLEKCFYP